jgi:hypothetical protein
MYRTGSIGSRVGPAVMRIRMAGILHAIRPA